MTRSELKAKAKAQLGGRLFGDGWLMALLAEVILAAIAGAAAGLGAGICGLLVSGPLLAGMQKLYLKQAQDGEVMKLEGLFDGFKRFGENVLLGLMQELFVFLWSLLFVIPGIVAVYRYALIFYIRADHPEYDWRTCFNESKRLMSGHKMELFVLHLSFLGWILVGTLTLGIGLLWVVPYMNATEAQFYRSLTASGVQ